MPRGGRRTPGPDKKLGRPKSTQGRPVDGNVARKIKQRIKAEELWVQCVALAYKKARETGNTADLRQCLEYLDDRDFGRCAQSVFIGDTRDATRELDFGDLPKIIAPSKAASGKPN